MSSLALNASPWTNDSTKKRQPSIRRTAKKPSLQPDEPSIEIEEEEVDAAPFETKNQNDLRNAKVQSLLQQMSDINIDNDGNKLAEFQPIPYPEIQQPRPPNFEKYRAPTNFSANSIPLDKTTDYHSSYTVPQSMHGKPYHDTNHSSNAHDKIFDRLGYIVHLLEQQQNEKTDTVMEEYILYVLLGTFIIFVVDSFSRSNGKYIR